MRSDGANTSLQLAQLILQKYYVVSEQKVHVVL